MWKCFYIFVKHNQLKTLQHTHLYQFHHKVPSWGLVFILKKRLLFYDCLVSFLRKCDSLLSRTRDFSICQSIHTNPKKHPSLLPIDYWGGVLSLSIKWSQHNADHSPSFTAKVKNGHSCISTPHSCSQHAQGFCHAYWIIEGKCIYETCRSAVTQTPANHEFGTARSQFTQCQHVFSSAVTNLKVRYS